jgi:hypothetical protein
MSVQTRSGRPGPPPACALQDRPPAGGCFVPARSSVPLAVTRFAIFAALKLCVPQALRSWAPRFCAVFALSGPARRFRAPSGSAARELRCAQYPALRLASPRFVRASLGLTALARCCHAACIIEAQAACQQLRHAPISYVLASLRTFSFYLPGSPRPGAIALATCLFWFCDTRWPAPPSSIAGHATGSALTWPAMRPGSALSVPWGATVAAPDGHPGAASAAPPPFSFPFPFLSEIKTLRGAREFFTAAIYSSHRIKAHYVIA